MTCFPCGVFSNRHRIRNCASLMMSRIGGIGANLSRSSFLVCFGSPVIVRRVALCSFSMSVRSRLEKSYTGAPYRILPTATAFASVWHAFCRAPPYLFDMRRIMCNIGFHFRFKVRIHCWGLLQLATCAPRILICPFEDVISVAPMCSVICLLGFVDLFPSTLRNSVFSGDNCSPRLSKVSERLRIAA